MGGVAAALVGVAGAAFTVAGLVVSVAAVVVSVVRHVLIFRCEREGNGSKLINVLRENQISMIEDDYLIYEALLTPTLIRTLIRTQLTVHTGLHEG